MGMTIKETFADMEMQCTSIKQRVYMLRDSVRKVHLEASVEVSLIEHLDKIYREFDQFQEFCKSRS